LLLGFFSVTTKEKATMSRPINILQVEDTPSDALLTAHALNSAGIPHSIQVIGDGEQAIAFLKAADRENATRPDLILLDWSLPGMNGNEVLQFIKADPASKVIPVVIFTTQDSHANQLLAYEHCANSYVLKPSDLEGFVSAVQSIATYWSQTSVRVPVRQIPIATS
jgi:two-component system, chemotaxis family, response regulator Rcp1